MFFEEIISYRTHENSNLFFKDNIIYIIMGDFKIKRPRIFISHCEKNMGPTEYAMRIIELMGCEPMLAERQPKGSNSVNDVVRNLLDTCDAALVIATGDLPNGNSKSPSNGVSVELGLLETNPKFKNKYFVFVEEGVVLSAMNGMARYTFKKEDYSQIATAILVELGSMNLFRNYYEMPGSDIGLHKVVEALSDLQKLGATGVLANETFIASAKEQINQFISNFVKIS